ncbi:Mitogen-activated protein kinase kinase kinase 3 [Diplonema papillatum]|nr:Mitogen-activated protein kinase kinase kinase 3 [Diplonema papillatum]
MGAGCCREGGVEQTTDQKYGQPACEEAFNGIEANLEAEELNPTKGVKKGNTVRNKIMKHIDASHKHRPVGERDHLAAADDASSINDGISLRSIETHTWAASDMESQSSNPTPVTIPWARLLSRDPKYQHVTLFGDVFTFGRSPTCSYSLPNNLVSSTQFTLYYDKSTNVVELKDRSTNGTYVFGFTNSGRISGSQKLQHGDHVTFQVSTQDNKKCMHPGYILLMDNPVYSPIPTESVGAMETDTNGLTLTNPSTGTTGNSPYGVGGDEGSAGVGKEGLTYSPDGVGGKVGDWGSGAAKQQQQPQQEPQGKAKEKMGGGRATTSFDNISAYSPGSPRSPAAALLDQHAEPLAGTPKPANHHPTSTSNSPSLFPRSFHARSPRQRCSIGGNSTCPSNPSPAAHPSAVKLGAGPAAGVGAGASSFKDPTHPSAVRGKISYKVSSALLGEGANSRVHLGMNKKTGELIAVKRLSKKPLAPSEIRDWEKEVHILSSLCHPNIVQYLGCDVKSGEFRVLLGFVPGGSVASLLHSFGPLSDLVVRNYTQQILLGLRYLHKHDVVHMDIKGANILVTNEGSCLLSDFGASAMVGENAGGHAAVTGKTVLGTPSWMAPEVVRDRECTKFSDVWSLACTVVEMASGKIPWAEKNFEDKLVVLHFHRTNVTGEHPSVPQSVGFLGRDFCKQCFHPNSHQRPTVAQLLQHPFLTSSAKALPSETTASEVQSMSSLAYDFESLTITNPPSALSTSLPHNSLL